MTASDTKQTVSSILELAFIREQFSECICATTYGYIYVDIRGKVVLTRPSPSS